MSAQIRRDAERFLTDAGDITTRHSFSYGAHYDPEQIGFGPIRAINTERLAPGAGYEPHRHADVEIVTWVVEGSLRHADGAGGGGVIEPGTAQRLSAGTGVEHTETNASTEQPLVFVQMMLDSDHEGAPIYDSVDLGAQVAAGSGALLATVGVHAPATLWFVRLEAGQSVQVPGSPRSLVHVVSGKVQVLDTDLLAGDEARLADAGPYDLSAAATGGEALVWQLETR